MNRPLFIVNPRAGKGRGEAAAKRLQAILTRDNVPASIVYTRGPGDARSIASGAGAETIVAVGGDGTINEIVNGIAGSAKKLGIIPAGSGNDTVKSFGIPSGTQEALDTIKQSAILRADLGEVSWSGSSGAGRAYFVNGAGIGFDALVAHRAGRIGWLRGTALYLAAVLLTIRDYRPPRVTLRVDGNRIFEQEQLLVAVGNGACAGGGFYLTPDALPDDGHLDLCGIAAIPAMRILRLIPRVLNATHRGANGILLMKGKEFNVSSADPLAIHVNGEVLTLAANEINISVRAESLPVLVPQTRIALKRN